jgi:hypothetical protein
VVLSAVDQIEDLTTRLSGKIWQKIMILEQMMDANGPETVRDLFLRLVTLPLRSVSAAAVCSRTIYPG